MKRRQLRFHLGFLMLVIALLAVPLAFHAERERRRAEAEWAARRELVKRLEELIGQAHQEPLPSIARPKPATTDGDSTRANERPPAPKPPSIPEFDGQGDFRSSE
jgi:hypothetical protein